MTNSTKPSGTENLNVDHRAFWGKASRTETDEPIQWHPVAFHCLDVAAVSETILNVHHGLRDGISSLLGIGPEHAVPLIRYLICLHDIGKFAKRFQSKVEDLYPACFGDDPKGLPSGYDHSSGGYMLFNSRNDMFHLPETTPEASWDPLISAVAGHHGVPPSQHLGNARPAQVYFGSLGISAAETFVNEIVELLPIPSDCPPIERSCARQASYALAGLTTLSDWIGSNIRWFPFRGNEEFGSLLEYWIYSIGKARLAVEETGILPAGPADALDYGDLIGAGSIPSPMQAWAQSVTIPDGPSLFIIEDETGSGKTEAALMLAYRLMASKRADGLYVALPTMATANAMFDRIGRAKRHLFPASSSPSTALVHRARDLHMVFRDLNFGGNGLESQQSNILNIDESGDENDESSAKACRDWIADDRRKAFLADAGAGTVDQAIMAILPSKFQALRLLGLMRRVLILDEVHAYDSYMNEEIRTLLEFQAGLGGCAIVLSATLPLSVREGLADAYSKGLGNRDRSQKLLDRNENYPSASVVFSKGADCFAVKSRSGQARSLQVNFLNAERQGLDIVESAYRKGKAAIYIRNTVDDAFDAWEELTGRGVEATLFHSRFALDDRLEIEKDITRRFGKYGDHRDRKGVVVATQVVEQSLDLDFDEMVTDLAPIDLLIQRAGRLWRHGHRGNRQGFPTLHVVGPDPHAEPDEDWYKQAFRRGAWVYQDHARIWLTAKVLKEAGSVKSPDGLRRLIEAVYSNDAFENVPESLHSRFFEAEGRAGAERGAANMNVLGFRQGYFRSTHWESDVRTFVRLNDDPSVTLRLARVKDGRIEPFCGGIVPRDVRHAWRLSEVNVPARLVTEEFVPTDLSDAARHARDQWTRYDEDKLMVVLNDTGSQESGFMRGQAIRDGNEVNLRYCKNFGLRIGS